MKGGIPRVFRDRRVRRHCRHTVERSDRVKVTWGAALRRRSRRVARNAGYYRLSQSEHCNQFILKGAMLFSLWSTETHRPTRDVDLPGFGESDEATLQQTFSDLCRVPVEDDGLLFLADSIKGRIDS